MRNLCITLIIVLVVPAVWFSSCAKIDDYEGAGKPTVSDVRFNANDTLLLENGEVIILNDSTKTSSPRIDTFIIGKTLYLNARFRDSIGLSSYRVKIIVNLETEEHLISEKTLEIKALGEDIFSTKGHKIKDIIVIRNRLFSIPETITKSDAIYTPKQGLYDVQIACGNIANRVDSTSFYYKVLLLSRDSILSIRKKQNI